LHHTAVNMKQSVNWWPWASRCRSALSMLPIQQVFGKFLKENIYTGILMVFFLDKFLNRDWCNLVAICY